MSAHDELAHALARGVDALGWTLLHFLWQGALVAAATALALAALRDGRPQTRYLVACGGLLASVLWPALSLALRLHGGSDAAGAGAQVAVALNGAVMSGTLRQSMPWLVAAWAGGSVLLAARSALGLAWIARARRTGAPDPRWQACTDRLARAIGVARQVRLRVVSGLASPVTAGCWHPVVLVPASLIAGMPPELLQALLAHELAHVRRHDYLVNLLQNLAEILLFFHPAVWWISRRIRIERELIADDIAAAHCGGGRQLALALSELEKRQFAHHEPALAADGGDLMNRIARLLHTSPSPRIPAGISTLLAGLLPALAAACALAAGLAHAAEPVRQADKPPHIDFNSCAKPVWPPTSLAAKETGKVTLAFLVDKDGTVADTRVKKSSGHPALDEAAVEGIRKCTFEPGLAAGKPVKSWVDMQYVWTLE
jgi:D-alanyl-D-alanine endopeptidase (penicillin-binding protein 7)